MKILLLILLSTLALLMPIDAKESSITHLQPSPSITHHNPTLLTLKERQWLDANPDVEIASDHSWYPFVFINQQGQIDGFNKELIELINQNLQTNFSIKRHSSWSDAYEQLISGKIWALMSVTPTQERQQFLSFSPVYYFAAQHILTKADDNDINTLQDLAGKRIAIFKNHLISDFINQHVTPKEIHYLESTEAAYQAVASGAVEASIFTHASDAKAKSMNLKIAVALFNNTGNLAIATHNSQPLLHKIINKGISSISKKQLADLTNKWFNTANNNRLFTDEEFAYIKDSPPIKVGVDTWKP